MNEDGRKLDQWLNPQEDHAGREREQEGNGATTVQPVKRKTGTSKSGMILIWQLRAKNNPQRIGCSRRHMKAARTRNMTITGSVLP